GRSEDPACRNDHHRQCVHAPVDRRQKICPQSRSASGLGRILYGDGQPPHQARQGALFHQRRWAPDAYQEEPGTARSAVFQPTAEVTLSAGVETRRSQGALTATTCPPDRVIGTPQESKPAVMLVYEAKLLVYKAEDRPA